MGKHEAMHLVYSFEGDTVKELLSQRKRFFFYKFNLSLVTEQSVRKIAYLGVCHPVNLLWLGGLC